MEGPASKSDAELDMMSTSSVPIRILRALSNKNLNSGFARFHPQPSVTATLTRPKNSTSAFASNPAEVSLTDPPIPKFNRGTLMYPSIWTSADAPNIPSILSGVRMSTRNASPSVGFVAPTIGLDLYNATMRVLSILISTGDISPSLLNIVGPNSARIFAVTPAKTPSVPNSIRAPNANPWGMMIGSASSSSPVDISISCSPNGALEYRAKQSRFLPGLSKCFGVQQPNVSTDSVPADAAVSASVHPR